MSHRLPTLLILFPAAMAGLVGLGTSHAADIEDCVRSAEEAQPLMTAKNLREARERLMVCARQQCPTAVRRDCEMWLRQVERDTPTVIVSLRDASGNMVTPAEITVDGTAVPKTDKGQIPLNPGEHVIRARATDGSWRKQRVTAAVGQQSRAIVFDVAASSEAGPDTKTSTKSVVTWSLAAGALVAAGAGIGYGIAANNAQSAASAYRASNPPTTCFQSTSAMCKNWSDAVDAQASRASLSHGFFIAGGALALGALGAWLLWPSYRPSETATLQIKPSWSARDLGMIVQGSF